MKLVIGIVVGVLAVGCSKKSEAPAGGGSSGSNTPAVEPRDALVATPDGNAAVVDAAIGSAVAPTTDNAIAVDAHAAETIDAASPVRVAGDSKATELRAEVDAVDAAFEKAAKAAADAKTVKAACAGLADLGSAISELADFGPANAEHEWQEARQDAAEKLGQVLVLCNERGRKPAEVVEGLDGIRGELATLRGALRSN
ncbi:MAG TPA: hypothetical protein VFV99_22000 [Kofleriaceae bacterium]|nr:hypothetical protein [Kofleriaceae bacterium]